MRRAALAHAWGPSAFGLRMTAARNSSEAPRDLPHARAARAPSVTSVNVQGACEHAFGGGRAPAGGAAAEDARVGASTHLGTERIVPSPKSTQKSLVELRAMPDGYGWLAASVTAVPPPIAIFMTVPAPP